MLSYHKDIENRINEILPFHCSLLKSAEEISKNAPVPMGIYKKRFEAMETFQNEQIENALDVADAIKNRAENEAKGIVEDAKQKAKNIIDNAKQEAKSIIDNAQNIYAENEQLKEENADLQKVCDAYDALALEFMLEDRATTIQLLQECNFSNSYIESVIAKADDIIKQNQKNCAYYDYDER